MSEIPQIKCDEIVCEIVVIVGFCFGRGGGFDDDNAGNNVIIDDEYSSKR